MTVILKTLKVEQSRALSVQNAKFRDFVHFPSKTILFSL